MRIPEYLSNSSLKTWETDRREFYLRYLCDVKSPKIAQTPPMAIGSAFDGLVKNAIEKMLNLPVRDYSRQIEATDGPVREEALRGGQAVMDFYRKSNGLNRLLVTGVPRMEFSVKGIISGTEHCVGGPVIISGKPDLYYRMHGMRVVHDWKVNGYYSKASPHKGYIWDSNTGGAHKDVIPKWIEVPSATGVNKIAIGRRDYFNPEWLDQETGYGWMLGEAFGDEFLLQIHQITNGGPGVGERLRLTEHRVLSDKEHQNILRDRYVGCWEAIHSGRCFTDLSPEEDRAEQANCDLIAKGLQDSSFNALVGR